jgi:hypothetical protein
MCVSHLIDKCVYKLHVLTYFRQSKTDIMCSESLANASRYLPSLLNESADTYVYGIVCTIKNKDVESESGKGAITPAHTRIRACYKKTLEFLLVLVSLRRSHKLGATIF